MLGLTAIFRLAPGELCSVCGLSPKGPFRRRFARRLAVESIALGLYTIQFLVKVVVHSSLLLDDFPELRVLRTKRVPLAEGGLEGDERVPICGVESSLHADLISSDVGGSGRGRWARGCWW